ncbi:DEAD/DEAH box helicase [Auraticoccus monumenti]|uniref:Superfamily II DNA and RNA helicase n=1 Tax=Auraticoccus monumenti TaxID=675864 RepID=A0A1G6XH35_9ACTN|nr:DEAD/DEAH box helicase [Auraticoccus monumenti]SDD77372.1 Superfamily II DNA and RNA helicase [Auraticoccus monumenti]
MSDKYSSTPAGKASAKSHKADGTAKKRWSSAERATRGHDPRKSGGRPRTERSDRPAFERSDRPAFERSDRPAFERSDRPAFERSDRPRRDDRPARPNTAREDRWGDRKPRFERDDRKPRFERDDRSPRTDDRGPRFERDDRKPRFERDDRAPRFERDDRKPRFERDDRKPRFERDDRGPRSDDRGPRSDDRGPRSDDRGARTDDRAPRNEWRDRPAHSRGGSRPPADQHGGRRFESRPHRFAERSHASRDSRPERAPRSDRDERRPEWQQVSGYERDVEDQMSWSEATAVDVESLTPAGADNGFAGLGLPAVLVDALSAQGITTPFPIQSATIPDALAGKDVLGRGQTGSGKTLGFGLPLLTRLAEGRRGRTRAVVLVPTRELAMQVADVLSPLASTLGLSVVLIAGGMAYGPQLKAFSKGVDVVVATPGRLIDLMDQGEADLSDVEVTVLDEADHMADLGFLPAVRRILDSVPPKGQRLLFSATLDRGVDRVVREYLTDPVTHEVDSGQATVSTMTHIVYQVKPFEKQALTAEVANREGRTVVFVRTQRGADRIAGQLREAGVMAGALHGGLTQGARSRILTAFKDGGVPVLVATDVAARGIHVDEVSLVLQVDPPMSSKDYLHRAGRTARAGGEGVVVTLSLPHQRHEVARLVKQAGVRIMAEDVTLDDERVYRSTGARKPSRPAIEDREYETLIAPPVKVRSSRPGGGGARGRGRSFGGGRPTGGRGRRDSRHG